MCDLCDTTILNEVMIALDPLFEQHGKRKVIDIIHDYFHAGQPSE